MRKTIIQFVLTMMIALSTGLFAACGNKAAGHADAAAITYKQYCNTRYNYCVDYPTILTPQGESDSGDGQMFLSEADGREMLVYVTRILNDDADTFESLKDAYEYERSKKSQASVQKFESNYYLFESVDEAGKHCIDYTYDIGDDGMVLKIVFYFTEADRELFATIAKQVTASITGIAAADNAAADDFMAFAFEFLNTSFWNKNFYALLRDNSDCLRPYLDPAIDLYRVHAPGVMSYAATRAEGFGFNEVIDFTAVVPNDFPEYSLISMTGEESPCEIDFDDDGNRLYYQTLERLPSVVVDPESFTTRELPNPYPGAPLKALYVYTLYKENRVLLGLYFVKTSNGWKLAVVDDSLCSA